METRKIYSRLHIPTDRITLKVEYCVRRTESWAVMHKKVDVYTLFKIQIKVDLVTDLIPVRLSSKGGQEFKRKCSGVGRGGRLREWSRWGGGDVVWIQTPNLSAIVYNPFLTVKPYLNSLFSYFLTLNRCSFLLPHLLSQSFSFVFTCLFAWNRLESE